MTNAHAHHVLVWLLTAGVLLPYASRPARAAERALGVSPGETDRVSEVPTPCPTFLWGGVPEAAGYELVVLDLALTEEPAVVLRHRIAGAALGWTPSRDACLPAGGSYAWSVRALDEAGQPLEGEAGWATPRRFAVPALPSAEEVAAALETLRRWQAGEPGEAPARPQGRGARSAPVDAIDTGAAGDAGEASGTAAIRGENPATGADQHGVWGQTASSTGGGVVAVNTGSGPDLVLDGAAQGQADTWLTESGLDRPSPVAQTFDIGNSGSGTMTLLVDGQEVVTVLTDQDTLAALSCGDQQVAKWIGGSWTCAADDGETYLAGNQLQLSGTTFDVVEGAGSGLDADLLDGLQGSAFALSGHLHAGEEIVAGTVAEPRIAAEIARDAEVFPIVLANDGPGSGLDADTLDGADATAFQARVTGTCPAGQAVQAVHADGTVTCYEVPVPPRLTTVDSAGIVGSYSSVALGTDGFPVISYVDSTNADLKVVKCNDAACAPGGETYTTVDSAGNVGETFTSLAVGTDGFPVISYYDATNGDLKVVKCNDAACAPGGETLTTVDSAGIVGYYTSLALGTDGFPVISYRDSTNGDLKVVKCDDAACAPGGETYTTVDSAGNVGYFTSLALSTDGFPVISNYDATNGDLKVVKCDDPACAPGGESFTTIDSAGDVGAYTSLALGTDGFPVISYYDATNGDLKVVKCNDAACAPGGETLTTVDSAGIVGYYTSLALGTDGFPVISYRDSTNGDLKVVKCDDAACAPGGETLTTVDSAGDVGYYPSLALGTDGFPVISYRDGTNGDLKVAKCRNASCRD